MRIVIAAVLYFGLVFLVAFALGIVRTLWLEPAIGETWAVACEAPFLIAAMLFAARFVVRRMRAPRSSSALLGVGALALLLQQLAELALVLAAGETIASHLAYLGTPAGMIYVAALVAFVVMPFAINRAMRL